MATQMAEREYWDRLAGESPPGIVEFFRGVYLVLASPVFGVSTELLESSKKLICTPTDSGRLVTLGRIGWNPTGPIVYDTLWINSELKGADLDPRIGKKFIKRVQMAIPGTSLHANGKGQQRIRFEGGKWLPASCLMGCVGEWLCAMHDALDEMRR